MAYEGCGVRGNWGVIVEMLAGIGKSGNVAIIIWYGRCGVYGQGILTCKCRIVNWKYVTVGDGRL